MKIEIPIFYSLSNLNISSIVLSSSTKVKFSSNPVITSLGNGKFLINLSYSPTGENNGVVASYPIIVTINFTSIAGNISLNSQFVYINSDG